MDNNCNGLVDEGFAVPDWAFADFQMFRGFVNPGYLIGDYANPNPFYMPVLRYNFQIENQGSEIGDAVYKNLLFMSVEETRAKKDCSANTPENRARAGWSNASPTPAGPSLRRAIMCARCPT